MGKRKELGRRTALQALFVMTGTAAFGRLLGACSDDATSPTRLSGSTTPERATTPPNDGDEFVPGQTPPVQPGDAPPTVPSPVWEARAKQLEDDQKRVYGQSVFTVASAGPFAGKERSHVPSAVAGTKGSNKTVTVAVQHVMGSNGLDAGAYDAGDAGDAAKPEGGADAGDAGAKLDAGADAGDAGTPPVHYITTIYLRGMVNGKDTVVGLWEFASTDPAPPSVEFVLPAGVTAVEAYEHCTLHGLWKSAPIDV
jgi:hypothetical protein